MNSQAAPAAPAPAHLSGADWARALGVIGVILIHEEYYPNQTSGFAAQLFPAIDMLARFSVPLFIILTAIMLGYRQGAYSSVGQFLQRRLSRSVMPWLVWAPIYFLWDITIQPVIVQQCGQFTFAHCAEQFFLYGGGHLYFLLIVPQLYLLSLIWPLGRRGRLIAAVTCMAIQTGLHFFRLYGVNDSAIGNELIWWHGPQFFYYWIGYFAVGVLIGGEIKRGIKLPGNAWLWLLGCFVSAALVIGFTFSAAPNFNPFLTGVGAFGHPFMPLWAFSTLGLFWIWGRNRHSKIIDEVSTYSLGIYILHPLFLPYTTNALLPMALPWSLLGSAVQVALLLALAYVLCRLIAATPLASIIGNQPTPLKPRA
jgi:surface polysaccharide O-acyltransferase-like enzyme